MNKMFKYASLSAIAFVGAVSFSACSSSDDMTESPNNPNYNPETNKVKTEFVINVTQPGERTRMTADNAGAGTFQELNNMQLICFANTPGTDNEFAAADKLTLTPYTGPAVSGDNTTNSSKVYTLYIPNGTTNFLFYATTHGTVGDNDKFTYGSLVNNLGTASTVVTATPENTDIKFNLKPIASEASTVTTPQGTLLTVLNGIAGASYNNGTTDNTTDDITWASTTNKTETQWQALRTAFNQFTNQASGGDVRQGSSAAILSMVFDLFGAVNAVYTSEQDADAKGVAEAILEQIRTYFNVTLSGTTYTWDSPAYKSDVNFPEGVNLPAGAAVIAYKTTPTQGFYFVNDGQMGTATVSTAYNKFTYPSELTYYCNSGLRQSTTSKAPGDYPTTSAEWIDDNNTTWSGWTTGAVTAATRAVAMKDNITYGAAQLVSNVRLADNVADDETNALVDNRNAITNHVEADQKFYGTGDNAITLKVHGLLIGSQPDAARYDYLPQGTTFSNVVYDKFSSGTAVTTSEWATPNYTLVLDNYTTAGSGLKGDQTPVNVALEMTANKDFYGASGKIKAGQKFYLIGALDPTPFAVDAINWSKHVSFKSTDTGYNVNRVFIRDAKTTATFTLGKECLKKAYSTIPDLRSTQMVFGISVDLAWKTGLVFDVPIN